MGAVTQLGNPFTSMVNMSAESLFIMGSLSFDVMRNHYIFLLFGFPFMDNDDSKQSREREGDQIYSFLSLLPAHEHEIFNYNYAPETSTSY